MLLAPLAAGGVHHPIILIVCPAVLIGVAVLTVSEWRAGSRLKLSMAALFPAAFAILTALQLVPLPPALIDRLDPDGANLLLASTGAASGWRPLTMDAPGTTQALVRAVMAFLVFLGAYHLAAKRSGHSWLLRSVAAGGVAAVIIGLGHRLFDVQEIYGMFPNTRHLALLTGPFINANHNAEFLELATFVGIACANQASTPLGRIGWRAASVTSMAGALATLSRSSIVALAVGVAAMILLSLSARGTVSSSSGTRPRVWPAIVGAVGVVAVAGSIGAAQMLSRFQGNAVLNDLRFGLWRDSLNVLRVHPFGIGREAFDTVYPIYRTLAVRFPLRFSFVENQPLQLLIDFGYLGFVLVAVAAYFPIRELVRKRRRDRVEVALIAALAAVAAHSVTDFGLETLGVLLPVFAVLGTLLGRTYVPPARLSGPDLPPQPSRRERLRGFAPSYLGLALGLLAVWRQAEIRTGRDFDALLRDTLDADERRGIISAARRAHPFDYYYPLVLSTVEPLTSATGRRSPRLRALNQALSLCPNCSDIHLQVARTMWRLGRRSQALAEWAAAARGHADVFQRSLAELLSMGARPNDLARLAENDPQRLLRVAAFLLDTPNPESAAAVIDAAANGGALPTEVALLRAQMALTSTDQAAEEQAVAEAKRLAPLDPRVALAEAKWLLRSDAPDQAARALDVVERSLDRDPSDLPLQTIRLEIVARQERWSAADRAIAGYKQALQTAGASSVPANLAAAGIYLKMGRVRDAMTEYRIATTAEPQNVSIWRDFGMRAQAAGHLVQARDAYQEVMRLAPSKEVGELIRHLDDAQAAERLGLLKPVAPNP